MMIAKHALAIVFVLVCLMGTTAFSQAGIQPDSPRLLTFDDLKRNDGIEGTIQNGGHLCARNP
jgi:hypothetical protein